MTSLLMPLLTAVIMLPSAARAESHTHTYPAGTRTLDITSSQGTIRVRTGGAQISVTGTQPNPDSMCGVAYDDTAASVTFGPRGTASNARPCEMTFDVTVPSGVSLSVKLGVGHVDIQHDGGLHATIDTGTVQGSVGAASNLTLTNGEVQLLQLTQPIELRIAKGAADLGWSTAPEGTILVNVADGDLRIDLPDDAPVDARVPPTVKVPQPQKTTAPTKLQVGKTSGVILLQ